MCEPMAKASTLLSEAGACTHATAACLLIALGRDSEDKCCRIESFHRKDFNCVGNPTACLLQLERHTDCEIHMPSRRCDLEVRSCAPSATVDCFESDRC